MDIVLQSGKALNSHVSPNREIFNLTTDKTQLNSTSNPMQAKNISKENELQPTPKYDRTNYKTFLYHPSTSLLVGNLYDKPDRSSPLGMGGEKCDNIYSGSKLPWLTSNGVLESRTLNLWPKCVDGESLPSYQLLLHGLSHIDNPMRVDEPNKPESTFLPTF